MAGSMAGNKVGNKAGNKEGNKVGNKEENREGNRGYTYYNLLLVFLDIRYQQQGQKKEFHLVLLIMVAQQLDHLRQYQLQFRLVNSAAVNLGSATAGLSPTIFGTLFFLVPDVFPLLIAII